MSGLEAKYNRNQTGIIRYWLGRSLLAMFGWRVEGEIPHQGNYILVGGPHTSNWDFPVTILSSFVFRIKLHWMGKDVLFRQPYGWIMRMLGGISIDRSRATGKVEQIKQLYQQRNNLIIAISPKGTRNKTSYWKSGFYWIAYTAQVPVLCVRIDVKQKCVRMAAIVNISGNIKQDMDMIRDSLKGMNGFRPEFDDVVRLKEEDVPD